MVASHAGANTSILLKIRKEAIRQGFDPRLAESIARAESSLNPKAVSYVGAIGLFQVMPFHANGGDLREVNYNIKVGIKLLLKYKHQCADMGEAWIICYNQGPRRRPKHPLLHPYYKVVQSYYRGSLSS